MQNLGFRVVKRKIRSKKHLYYARYIIYSLINNENYIY